MLFGRRWLLYLGALAAALGLLLVTLGSTRAPMPAPSREGRTPAPAAKRAPRPTLPEPARPARGEHSLQPDEVARSAPFVHRPSMRRWQPLVRRVAGDAPEDFALLMALILVESGGRQFAVSRTGCIGLMQFCARTALRHPFSRIYEIERLRPCRCRGHCRISFDVRRFLETTPRALHPIVAGDFPCSLTDPRFDPEQAIRAGWAYVSQLSAAFAGNIYLIYIGYNSGPHVAQRIWDRLGARKAERLAAIGRGLRRALAPNFGRAARRRARALLRVHLPKIARVYRHFYRAEVARIAALPVFRLDAQRCVAAEHR